MICRWLTLSIAAGLSIGIAVSLAWVRIMEEQRRSLQREPEDYGHAHHVFPGPDVETETTTTDAPMLITYSGNGARS